MDKKRADAGRRRRRRGIAIGLVVMFIAAVGFYFFRTGRTNIPQVPRSGVLTDIVKRGTLTREVHGVGTLVAREDHTGVVPAQTDATVVRILVLPGKVVKATSVLMELSSPTVQQEAQDAELQLKQAEAAYRNAVVDTQSALIDKRSVEADMSAQQQQAELQARTDESLYKLGVISGLQSSDSRKKADSLTTREKLEKEKVRINEQAVETQLAVQKAKVEQARALATLKQHNLQSLTVRAGMAGVLAELPPTSEGHPLQVGSHVTSGASLARIVEPDQLKATLKIAETDAREVRLGEQAHIDTHNGIVDGVVSRIDPAVQNGTVSVDVAFNGPLPQGARPDLTIDGIIELEQMQDVLSISRPSSGTEDVPSSLFRIDTTTGLAVRVPVKLGRGSATVVQVLNGLKAGDTAIISDMSAFDNANEVQVK